MKRETQKCETRKYAIVLTCPVVTKDKLLSSEIKRVLYTFLPVGWEVHVEKVEVEKS